MPSSPAESLPDVLLDAALDVLAERGLKGATTRAIAARAGMNEVTLFRRHGSKAALIRAALLRQAQGLGSRGLQDTGDLTHDLETLVREYQQVLRRLGPVLGVLMTELPRHPEYLPVLDGPRAVFAQVGALLTRYQERGQLRPEPLSTLLPALLGPLALPHLLPEVFSRALLAGEGPPPGAGLPSPEPAAHVRAFLHGRAAPGPTPPP